MEAKVKEVRENYGSEIRVREIRCGEVGEMIEQEAGEIRRSQI